MKYRPELDGLRAVAVLPVILFHAGFSLFGGGFVGVDIFFVLSGFLITSIICRQLDQGTFSIVNFYEKRARRILPALFVMMAATLPFAWRWLMPSDMVDFSQSLVAVSAYCSNVLFWVESGYWDTASELKPLLHTWTLAVEEQYYVLFPLFLMAMWRIGKQYAFPALLAVAATSLFFAQWGATAFPETAFYLLPTRAWELAVGASIAFLSSHHAGLLKRIVSSPARNEAMASVGLLAIATAIFAFDETTPFPGFYALVPTLGAGLVIVFASPATVVGRLLSLRPAVTVGLISYSAYLWHQPIFAFTRYVSLEEPSPILMASLSAVVLPLAYLTWKLVENPFRDKTRFTRKNIFTLSLIGSVFFIAVGLAGYRTGGFPDRDVVKSLIVRNYQPDNTKLREQSWVNLKSVMKDRAYEIEDNQADNVLWYSQDEQRQQLLLVGNSHSKDLYNILSASQTATDRFELARYGTQLFELADRDHPFYTSPNYQAAEVIVFASRYSAADLAALNEATAHITRDGKVLVLIKETFIFKTVSNKTLADQLLQKQLINGLLTDRDDQIATTVDQINAAHYDDYFKGKNSVAPCREIIDAIIDRQVSGRVVALDRMDYICDEGTQTCHGINNMLEKYLYDGGHNTMEGAKFFGAHIDAIGWLTPLLQVTGADMLSSR